MDELRDKLKEVDLVDAVHKARLTSMKLLEDQGISTLALILSKTLVDIVEHPEKVDEIAR
ncbi:MAG: hypothetical protein DDT28_01127 [Dehalococcoidia bacterium]|nr:hypothetical protein [Chloroflexota bacterium]